MQTNSDLGDRLARVPAEDLLLLQDLQLCNANFAIQKLQLVAQTLQEENEALKAKLRSFQHG